MLRIIRLVANICVTKFQQEFFCLNQVYIRKIGDKEQSPAHIPNLPRIPQSHWGRLRSSLSPKPARRKNGWRDGGGGGRCRPGTDPRGDSENKEIILFIFGPENSPLLFLLSGENFVHDILQTLTCLQRLSKFPYDIKG